jgi:NAD(P)-dependent dehydrogenase (short-subunit alcohol dehydrogenase family)
MRLDSKVVVVTGSGSGIGRATALRCAAEGAVVVVSDVNDDGGEETCALVRDAGGTAAFVHADVSAESDVDALMGEAVALFGALDVLVNNAGVSGRPHGDGAVVDVTTGSWRKILSVNLDGVFFCCRAGVARMLERGNGGAVVNISSVTGLLGVAEPFNTQAYAASKSALVGLSRGMALSYGKRGIRVNVVVPGSIVSPINEGALADPAKRAVVERKTMLPYLGRPEDIANAVAFLASDEARYITGAIVPVDGGWTAH